MSFDDKLIVITKLQRISPAVAVLMVITESQKSICHFIEQCWSNKQGTGELYLMLLN